MEVIIESTHLVIDLGLVELVWVHGSLKSKDLLKHGTVVDLWVFIDKSAKVDLDIVPKILHHLVVVSLLVLNGSNVG